MASSASSPAKSRRNAIDADHISEPQSDRPIDVEHLGHPESAINVDDPAVLEAVQAARLPRLPGSRRSNRLIDSGKSALFRRAKPSAAPKKNSRVLNPPKSKVAGARRKLVLHDSSDEEDLSQDASPTVGFNEDDQPLITLIKRKSPAKEKISARVQAKVPARVQFFSTASFLGEMSSKRVTRSSSKAETASVMAEEGSSSLPEDSSDESASLGSEDTLSNSENCSHKKPRMSSPVQPATLSVVHTTVHPTDHASGSRLISKSAVRKRKSSVYIPSSPYDLDAKYSSLFYSPEAESRFSLNLHKGFVIEKNRNMEVFENLGVVDFFTKRYLDNSLDFPAPYSRFHVLEFYANLTRDIALERFPTFGRVFVRDVVVDFSPTRINAFLCTPDYPLEDLPTNIDEAVRSVTGEKISKWTAEFRTSLLSKLFVFLHHVMRTNWLPTSNASSVTKDQILFLFRVGEDRFNLGQDIFDTVLSFAENINTSYSLPHPSLIYGMLKDQGVEDIPGENLSFIFEQFKIPRTMNDPSRVDDLAKFGIIQPPSAVQSSVPPVVHTTGHTASVSSAAPAGSNTIHGQIALLFRAHIISHRADIESKHVLISSCKAEIEGKQLLIAGLEKSIAELESVLGGSSQKGGDVARGVSAAVYGDDDLQFDIEEDVEDAVNSAARLDFELDTLGEDTFGDI